MHDFVPRGLLEKYPHALVIIYEKCDKLERQRSYLICIRAITMSSHGLHRWQAMPKRNEIILFRSDAKYLL